MINFANLKSLTIPEGNVKAIAINSVTVWGSGGAEPDEPAEPTYINQLTEAQAIDSTNKYNGLGYKTGVYLTSSGTFESTGKSNEWLTGCIPYTVNDSIYIKGVSFTTASHDRMYFFSSKTVRVAPAINSGTTNLGTYFTIETLGADYCKLTPKSGLNASTQFVRMSFTTGNPANVIITVNQPIE
jgi:hypothetical protein